MTLQEHLAYVLLARSAANGEKRRYLVPLNGRKYHRRRPKKIIKIDGYHDQSGRCKMGLSTLFINDLKYLYSLDFC